MPCRLDSPPPHRRFALRATHARCPIGLTARFASALPGPSTALTHRRPIGVCFGVASRLLIPLGQKLSLLANLPYSRRQFSPCGQKLHFCPIPLRTLGGIAGFATSSIDASAPPCLSALRAKAALLSNRTYRPLRVRPTRDRRASCPPYIVHDLIYDLLIMCALRRSF